MKNKNYKYGCVVSFFNRKEIVEKTFNSINSSFLPNNLLFVIIDDGSEEKININLKNDYIFIKKNKNFGISNSLAVGWDILYLMDIEYMMNLDSDVEVSTNWLSQLLNTKQLIKEDCIITGFNGSNHKITKENKNYFIKESIGGINIFFNKSLYKKTRVCLTNTLMPEDVESIKNSIEKYGTNPKIHPVYKGWDWGLMTVCDNEKISKLCCKPSVVQHTGRDGITSSSKFFEQSKDYKKICVPKIIHQMWKNKNIPKHLMTMQQSVIEKHKDYEYMFWTDDCLEKFIKVNYPEMYDFYNNFEYKIQQLDFIRLLILYHFGGIYIDLDSFCFKNVDSILNYPVSLVETEKHEAFSNDHYPFVLNNAFIAAEKGNDFINKIITNILEYEEPEDYYDFCSFNPKYTKVLKSAGPLCITDSYIKYEFKEFINILKSNYYYGTEKHIEIESKLGYLGENIAKLGTKIYKEIENCNFIHFHESSWWKKEGKIIEPPKSKKFCKKIE